MEGSLTIVIAAIAAGEVIIHVLLYLISKMIGKLNKDRMSLISIFKGVLERTFILVTLFFDLASSLTLLGALKIATRIKDQEDKVSNDFFVIGNLVSVLFGIIYFLLVKNLMGSHE
jgi:hypothetical protein